MNTAACLIYPPTTSTTSSTTGGTMKELTAPKARNKLHTTRLDTGTTESTTTTFSDTPEILARQQQELESLLLSPVSPGINYATSNSSDASSSGTIQAQEIPDDMLVALIDRPTEIKQLVQHNASFFEQLKHELQSSNDDNNNSTCWRRFEYTLYCDRSTLSDMEWMTRISKALSNVPAHYLSHFKVLVGYIGDEQSQQVNMMGKEFMNVDLVRLRRVSDLKTKISKQSYPQFFINCEKALKNDKDESDGNTYNKFVDLLFHTEPEQLSDHEWEKRMDSILKLHPSIMEQLQEIAAYELEDEETDDEE